MKIAGKFQMNLTGGGRLWRRLYRSNTVLTSDRGRDARVIAFHFGPFFIGASGTVDD